MSNNNVNVVKTVVVSPGERRMILDKIGKVCNYKNTTGNDVVEYVDNIAKMLLNV